MAQQEQPQKVPVGINQTDDHIMVAAPMPALEPENISGTIAGGRVTIRGEERGPRQHERNLVVAEWTVDPYELALTLPQPVSGRLANATYSNGVLVLSMPKLDPGQPGDHVELYLQALAVDLTHSERAGHMGRDILTHATEGH